MATQAQHVTSQFVALIHSLTQEQRQSLAKIIHQLGNVLQAAARVPSDSSGASSGPGADFVVTPNHVPQIRQSSATSPELPSSPPWVYVPRVRPSQRQAANTRVSQLVNDGRPASSLSSSDVGPRSDMGAQSSSPIEFSSLQHRNEETDPAQIPAFREDRNVLRRSTSSETVIHHIPSVPPQLEELNFGRPTLVARTSRAATKEQMHQHQTLEAELSVYSTPIRYYADASSLSPTPQNGVGINNQMSRWEHRRASVYNNQRLEQVLDSRSSSDGPLHDVPAYFNQHIARETNNLRARLDVEHEDLADSPPRVEHDESPVRVLGEWAASAGATVEGIAAQEIAASGVQERVGTSRPKPCRLPKKRKRERFVGAIFSRLRS